ncbi:target of EGR1 protein 1-like [Panonychus citri]|uniref:target of EGR1 protein 1-like n=1 Tax=Panonychus citri TaxID=50023 RepID=UPI002306E2A4|nr:target of EGR1 protein 1-like [Panonychus citri]
MDQLDRVPCIQVNSSNIDLCWSHLIKAIEQSHFVAIDLELSGLGDKKKLILKDIEDRFQAIGEVAKTRSILSVGLSFFRYNRRRADNSIKIPEEIELNEWNFKVSNYEILTLCNEESVLEDESRSFLVSHGFDFQLQQSSGLPYLRGQQESDSDTHSIRNLFKALISKKVPLVFHNGLLDLIFIYHNFLTSLPPKLTSFVADLDKLFPKGIFDTKYIAEHGFCPKGSYLEYLFYQRQRRNLERFVSNKCFIAIDFTPTDSVSSYTVHRSMKTTILGEKPDGLKICGDYRQHGWCKDGAECKRSHDIDFILDDEDIYKEPSKSRKRILLKMSSISNSKEIPATNGSNEETSEHINGQVKSGIHRSGYDAFMTGYCLATFIIQLSKPKPGKSGRLNFSTSDIKKITNKIFLTGKKDPLLIRFSTYSKPSSRITNILSVINKEEPEEENKLDENSLEDKEIESSTSSNEENKS